MTKRPDQKKRLPAKRTPAGKRRQGLPDPASVYDEGVLVSPKGRAYRVLRTTEKDPYDPPTGSVRRRSPTGRQ